MRACTVNDAGLVADFAVGDGALLEAAAERWPSARLLGVDISQETVQKLGVRCPSFELTVLDFLADSVDEHPLLRKSCGKCDVVVLNPPFSCRGNARFPVDLDGKMFRGSKALTFFARSIAYLHKCGEMVAVLPASCVTSEKDAELLRYLRSRYCVEVVGDVHRAVFDGRAVSVVIVRLSRRDDAELEVEPTRPSALRCTTSANVEIMRGSCPVHLAKREIGGVPLIHTTNLVNGSLKAPFLLTSRVSRILTGPVVLIPRVGKPCETKICFMESGTAVLSDCVIALRSAPAGREVELFHILREKWGSLRRMYGGSCAPYTTLDALQYALYDLGFSARIVASMSRGLQGVEGVSVAA